MQTPRTATWSHSSSDSRLLRLGGFPEKTEEAAMLQTGDAAFQVVPREVVDALEGLVGTHSVGETRVIFGTRLLRQPFILHE